MSGAERINKKRSLGEQLRDARYATLDSRAVSDNANKLVDCLTDEIIKWEIRYGRRRRGRRSGAEKLRAAVTGLLGDLLLARKPGDKANGWVYRSMQAQGFTGKRVSYRTFASLMDALKDFDLMEHRAPVNFWATGFDSGKKIVHRRFAARFRANGKLLKLSREYGITDNNVEDHFIEGLPEDPLVLKATSRRTNGRKERGRPIKFERTTKAETLRHHVLCLNGFLAEHVIRGGTHRGFIRVFNNGDDPDFDWNKGGRLYSPGEDSYQQLRRETRLRMTINGKPVCEIDVRASYLTILHARHHVPFEVSEEHDPYDIPGLSRFAVKSYVAVFLGSKKLPKRWPEEIRDEYAEENDGRNLSKDFPIKKVGIKVIEKIPLLARWGDLPETWADLMWLESEAVIATTRELMEKGIPSLPIHDSLLVPASEMKMTSQVLSRHYREICGVSPVLRLHQPI
jgi:hypothetical protein